MNKSYFLMLDTTGLLLSVFYFVVLLGGLFYISARLKVGFSKKSILLLFLYYYLIFLVGTMASFIPDFPDTELFGQIISENYLPWYQSGGVKFFRLITYPLRYMSLFRIELFMLFQISIFIISLMIIWKSWQIVLEKHQYNTNFGLKVFIALSMLFPGFILFIPIPLREFIALLGFSVMVYGLVQKYYNNSGTWVIVVGAFISIVARPQLVVVTVILFTLFQKNIWIKVAALISAFIVLPYLFEWIMGYSAVSPEVFAKIRNGGYTKYLATGFGYGYVEWHSYWDMIKSIPKLVSQFILSPLPILYDRNPFEMLAFVINLFFTLVIYVSVWYAGLRVSKVYVLIFAVSVGLFSLWEYHIGSAPRHAMPLVAILLPAASYGMAQFYSKYRGKSND